MLKVCQAQELSVTLGISVPVVPIPVPLQMEQLVISVQLGAIVLREVGHPSLAHQVPIVIQLVPPMIRIAAHVIRAIIV